MRKKEWDSKKEMKSENEKWIKTENEKERKKR